MRAARKETIVTAGPRESLLEYVARTQGLSLRKAKALLDTRNVFVNGRRVWMARHPLKDGDRVEFPVDAAAYAHTPPATLPILFSSSQYWVISKPPGLLSNGPGSAETILRHQTGCPVLRAVHRLDRETSGALCFARDTSAFDTAVAWFREGQVVKVYEAIVRGIPDRPRGTIRLPIDGAAARTEWTLVKAHRGAAHLRVRIHTGRTHQIRKHLAAAGHPVLGDRHYLTGRLDDPRLRAVQRQMLHASVLEAPLDDAGHAVRIHAPRPADFVAVLREFGLARS